MNSIRSWARFLSVVCRLLVCHIRHRDTAIDALVNGKPFRVVYRTIYADPPWPERGGGAP